MESPMKPSSSTSPYSSGTGSFDSLWPHEKVNEQLRSCEKRRTTESKKAAAVFGFSRSSTLHWSCTTIRGKKKKKNDNDYIERIVDLKKEAYEEKCCSNPEFDANDRETAGMFRFGDGGESKCWRRIDCGKMPSRPNARRGL